MSISINKLKQRLSESRKNVLGRLRTNEALEEENAELKSALTASREQTINECIKAADSAIWGGDSLGVDTDGVGSAALEKASEDIASKLKDLK